MGCLLQASAQLSACLSPCLPACLCRPAPCAPACPPRFPRCPASLPTAAFPPLHAARLPRPQATWYALIAGAEFWFNDAQNEQVAENLRERVRYLNEKVGAGGWVLAGSE